MRTMTTVLLSVGTMCALGQLQHAARADTNQPGQVPPPQIPPKQVPPQTPPPIPTDTPAGPANNSPGDPTGNAPVKPDPQTPGDVPTSPTTPPSQGDPGTTTPAPIEPLPPAPDATPTTTPPPPITDTTEYSEDVYSYAWSEPALQSGIGVSTILGGGVTGFTDKTMRGTTSDVGGLWDLRVTIGSHLPLALDISYLGSATNINGLPTGNKGRLIGTTVEGALRYNVLPHFTWTPYVFAGAGWQRYDVTQTSVSLSDSGMNSQDNLLEFPMGAGFAYRVGGFVADLRGTFRATTDNNLVLRTPPTATPSSDDFAPMHTWEASAALGYEF